MAEHHLAELNIAHMKYPLDAPEMTGFVERLDDINRLADQAPGFVWRLQTEAGDATSIDYFGPDYLVNLSVWEDIDSLHRYVYRSAHAEVMKQRHDWFERMTENYIVLWWVPAGYRPSIEEAGERLARLRRDGPGAYAFTLKQRFAPG